MPPDKQFVTIDGHKMAYIAEGEGTPIVLLHGNPTSSYLWRNILPYVTPHGRCIAPDLIGMGDSDKLDGEGDARYRFVEHRRYLDGLLDTLGINDNVILIVHDWGSVLGFDWARRHHNAVRGIAYLESFVRPLTWAEWPAESADTFRRLRSPEGEPLVLDENLFLERMLLRHPIDPDAADEYRRPFQRPGEDRRPMLTWPRQIPLDGEPADVTQIVADYAAWLASSPVPKLFINVEPGSILVGAQREFCRTWPNQHETTVTGGHFAQEWNPQQIGESLHAWLAILDQRNSRADNP